MRRPTFAVLSAVAALGLSAIALAPSAGADPSPTGLEHRNVHVCAAAPEGLASCDAIRRDTVDPHGQAQPQVTPQGLGPAQIRSAYGLGGVLSGGKTVAIVDAYDAPTAAADLATYRNQFKLPACTTANGCFHKVNQTGGTKLPRANGGWAQEISLDLDMVSATCPDCKILLVEANSSSFADLGAAVNYAAVHGAVAISNSYGGSDSNSVSTAKAYDHPGVAVTASTGDAGYGVESPASFPTVVAVGGTSLTADATTARGWSEAAWSGAGSGCSTLNAKPAWQMAADCPGKANADVSAVADPATGVAVYDSYAYQGAIGWMVFGGTSVSSPIIAGVYAMGTATAAGGYVAAYTWAHASGLHDITTGSNGSTCATTVWCAAGAGWDGPTGLGTPHGTDAF